MHILYSFFFLHSNPYTRVCSIIHMYNYKYNRFYYYCYYFHYIPFFAKVFYYHILFYFIFCKFHSDNNSPLHAYQLSSSHFRNMNLIHPCGMADWCVCGGFRKDGLQLNLLQIIPKRIPF